MRWTPEQLQEYEARRALAKGSKAPAYPPDAGPERGLQEKAEQYCRENGFHFFHDRSRGANEPGHTDLVIALPKGRTVWVELKSKQGRLSKDQKVVRMRLMALGHEWHEVRSYRQFVTILEGMRGE